MQALTSLQTMLARAVIRPAGGGALDWSIEIDGQHHSITIGPHGEWRASATWSDEDEAADMQEGRSF